MNSEEEFEIINQTNVPIMQRAIKVIYDMSEDTRLREIARLREKAMHDEASLLNDAREEGREEVISKMRAAGMTEAEIDRILG